MLSDCEVLHTTTVLQGKADGYLFLSSPSYPELEKNLLMVSSHALSLDDGFSLRVSHKTITALGVLT